MTLPIAGKLRASSLGSFTDVARLVGSRYYNSNLTVSGAELAVPAWTAGNASTNFVNGKLYRLEFICGMWNSGTANAFFDNMANVRKTVNSTAAQALMSYRLAAGGGSSPIVFHTMSGWVQNVSGGDIAASLGVSCARSTGTNAVMTAPIIVTVWDWGYIADYDTNTIAGLNPTSIV